MLGRQSTKNLHREYKEDYPIPKLALIAYQAQSKPFLLVLRSDTELVFCMIMNKQSKPFSHAK